MNKIFLIFFFFSFNCSSQEIVFKEYLKAGTKEVERLSRISRNEHESIDCQSLSNIWKFQEESIYTISNSLVLILDSDCNIIDTLNFDKIVLDLDVNKDFLIVSLSESEMDFSDNTIVAVNLKDMSRSKLRIGRTGAKFGLNLADQGNYFSFILQDEEFSWQKLIVFDIIKGTTTELEMINLEQYGLGELNYPATSSWKENDLYYLISSQEDSSKKLYKNSTAGRDKQFVLNLPKDYSSTFRMSSNGEKLISFKQNNYRYNQIVSLSIQNSEESVLYEAKQSTLSDLDDYELLE